MKEQHPDNQAVNVKQSLDYIQNGEPLAGYISENDVGPLNRTAKQLHNYILFLKQELDGIKIKLIEDKIKEEPKPDTEELDKINELTNSIEHIQKVVAQRLTESDKRLQIFNNELNEYIRNKPQNFLDYSTVQNLEKTIEILERKVQELEKNKVKEIVSEQNGNITEEQLAPYIALINTLESKVKKIEIEIGNYDKEQNQGSGIKNQIYQLLRITNRTSELLDNYQNSLSQVQENLISELIDQKVLQLKIKSEQSFSISKELNERMSTHEERIDLFERKYDIIDLLGDQELSGFLQTIQVNSNEALKNTQEIKEKNSEIQKELVSTTERSNSNEEQINKLKTLIGEQEFINNQILSTLETVVKTIGQSEYENSIIGQLVQIGTLKQEFQENIQNINMIIGQNVPGAETGFYKLLNEAKLGKVQYYKFRIPEKAKGFRRLSITLPEHIANKGDSFIVRTYQDHRNFICTFDKQTNKLYLDLGNLGSATDIIILPIKVEESGISENQLEYLDEREL